MSNVNSELEEIRRISQESQSAAQDRRFLKLSKLRKGESITVRMVGGWGKITKPTFGDKTKEEGDETYYRYEFEVLEGVGDIEAEQGVIYVWDSPKTYFKRLNPMVCMGHRMFKITRTHTKGERDRQGNILNVANYEILSADNANPALAIT